MVVIVMIFGDPCLQPWDFPFPRANAFAAPQLTEMIHTHISNVVAAAGVNKTDEAQQSSLTALQQAAEAGLLSEADMTRLSAVVNGTNSDVGQLYRESLGDPDASDFAGMLLGVLQARQGPMADAPPAPHTHTFTDTELLELAALAALSGPGFALGIAIAVASEHIHVTID